MPDAVSDPYTIRDGEAHSPPTNFYGRLKYLGPSLIVSGAVVGSGELILTSSLGATVGFALLWWMLLSCWCKSLVQAEITRYTIVSGDTYMRAMNRIPGRKLNLSWPIWVGLVGFIPGIMGLGGIMGGAGQALTLLLSLAEFTLDARWSTLLIAIVTSIILSSGSYKWLESVMLGLVVSFTLATLICSVSMQFTEFNTTPAEVLGGLSFDFSAFVGSAALALGAYGYTGVTAGDIASYTYWSIEKGYPSFVGSHRDDPSWIDHAQGWLKVMQTDVWLGLIILTCATLPYYFLGAGVLNKMGVYPNGFDTVAVLSNMFTQTLGTWAVWLFAFGAFFILFSTGLSGIGAGGRFIPDYFIEMGIMARPNLGLRRTIVRIYVTVIPFVGSLIFFGIPNPVILIMIGGLTSAATMPIQTGCTIWLQKRYMDQRIQPRIVAQTGLRAIFLFQFIMAWFVMWFVVIKPSLG